jgi:Domain of unknown function (DUF4126)
MDIISSLLTAFGLSGAAGLNAYIPLLAVAVLGRLEVVKLSAPFDALTSWWAIGVLGVLLVIELVADKVPVVDHINDGIQTFVRPAAGAVLFAANTGAVTGLDPAVSMGLGLLVAFGVHGAKAVTRPVVNGTTMGVGAPFMSAAEDAVSAVGSFVAIFLPLLIIPFFLLAVFLVWRLIKGARAIQSKLAGS